MNLRDEVEAVLRSWNAYEIDRKAPPIIDFDCHPDDEPSAPAAGRLAVHSRLADLAGLAARIGEDEMAARIGAHLAYLEAQMGSHLPIAEYIRRTQGCDASGWEPDYITALGDLARKHLAEFDVPWDTTTLDVLEESEGSLTIDDVAEAIRTAADDMEPAVRRIVRSAAPMSVRIEIVDLDAYWGYWLDGSGSEVRMRINRKYANFSTVRAQQFALHEILGHGLQCASYSHRCASEDVPWVRLTSVHAQQQVLLEGLAQALPLFAVPEDERLTARVRLAHYLELARSEIYLMINSGSSVSDCVTQAKKRVPFWTDEGIADALTDRAVNPLLRSYLWAYPAGIDWFVRLADEADAETISTILESAYQAPLTPDDLGKAWPAGPRIGGNREFRNP